MKKEACWVKVFQCMNCGEISSYPDGNCPFCNAEMLGTIDSSYVKYRSFDCEESESESKDCE